MRHELEQLLAAIDASDPDRINREAVESVGEDHKHAYIAGAACHDLRWIREAAAAVRKSEQVPA